MPAIQINKALRNEYESSVVVARVVELQRRLNTFPDIFINLDGVLCKFTSEAYKKVTGVFLPGDTRG